MVCITMRRKIKKFYYCFSKQGAIIYIDDVRDDITQFELDKNFNKYYLFKNIESIKNYNVSPGGINVIVKIQVLKYDELNKYYSISLSTSKVQVIIPVSGNRLMEYFDNAEELMR